MQHVRAVQQENIVHDEHGHIMELISEYDETVMRIHIVRDEQAQQHVQPVLVDIQVQSEVQQKVVVQYHVQLTIE